MRMRYRLLIATLGAALLAACTGTPTPNPDGPPAGGAPVSAPVVFDPTLLAANLAALPQEPGPDLGGRLADGLVPPTNRWFSGLVFGDEPLPVFPLPLSFALTESGFEFGVPVVTTSEKVIMGGHHPVIRVAGPTASWQVSGYDALSVTMTDTATGSTVQVAQGSPFVTHRTPRATELTTDGIVWEAADGHWTAQVAGADYGLVGDGIEVDGSTIRLADGGRATWFTVPEGGDAARMAALAVPLTHTNVAYSVDEHAWTTLTWAGEGGAETAFAARPHHMAGVVSGADCTLGTWPSTYGTLTACAGNELTWDAPLYEARAGLDLSGLSEAEASELRTQLVADVAADPAYPADTYFGGKALYRDAQLWHIATQLGADAEAATLRGRITDSLDWWMDPDRCATHDAFCFTWDPTNHGVVGRTASFGADEFNDHHFHYGYFLYAAGVLAADDPALAEKWAPVMDLLAADIANAPASEQLPQWRTFDPWASHSWASGTSPFADGNNQESSSEAVNAWAGLTLWARATDNVALENQARWLHALEAQSARAYWTDFDRTDPVYAGYGHQISPLNFGGKRDYATWFSAEPAAAMAILVIPASPSSDHLAGDPERIRANVAEAIATKGFDQQYGDYLLMYSALAGEQDRATALETARTVSDEAIDDGSTRTYLLAFLMAAAA